MAAYVEPGVQLLAYSRRDADERRPAADGLVVTADAVHEFRRRNTTHEVAHERLDRLEGVGPAEAEQDDAHARHGAYAPAPERMRAECSCTKRIMVRAFSGSLVLWIP